MNGTAYVITSSTTAPSALTIDSSRVFVAANLHLWMAGYMHGLASAWTIVKAMSNSLPNVRRCARHLNLENISPRYMRLCNPRES